MATSINYEVPSHVETSLTGFIGAGTRKVRNVTWRVELWATETYPRVYRDRIKMPLAMVPETGARIANQVSAFFAAAAALRR